MPRRHCESIQIYATNTYGPPRALLAVLAPREQQAASDESRSRAAKMSVRALRKQKNYNEQKYNPTNSG